jgi:ATP-dependent Clp protease ATP-binding subunit ClpC
VFERFTDRARRVVVLAQEEARVLNHDHIGTEHLLLGLIAEDEGLAAQELVSAGVDLERARRVVEEFAPPGSGTPAHIPFTPGSKRVLEHALREAQKLGHTSIGTEHILLGLLDEPDGIASLVLNRFVGDPEALRGKMLERLGAGREEATTPCCPRCREELTRTLAFRSVPARGHEGAETRMVLVTYCGACGTALGAHPE